MAEQRPEIALDMARHRVAEAEARLLRQRRTVAERMTNGQYDTAVMGMRVLRTLEANLAILRDHLRIEEQRCGSRPAGSSSVVEEAPPKAAAPQPR
jgi:hypothetical protein